MQSVNKPRLLIRNYQAGGQIVLTEALRRKAASGQPVEDEIDRLDKALREAEAMHARARQSLAQAQEEAERILAEAREQAVTVQAEAQAQGYQDGYAQGFAEGQAAGEQSLADVIQQLQGLLAAVQEERRRVLAHAEEEVVHLTLALAEKMVGPIAQAHREVVEHNAARALAELGETGPFILRVHPQDAAHLRERWAVHGPPVDVESWKLVEDETIEPGGCVLICGPATIDARLSTQMQALVDGLGVEV